LQVKFIVLIFALSKNKQDMKLVINNVEFPFDLGCRVLKLKHKENCPMEQLEDFWNDIIPLSFKEIAKLTNLEQRRIGILHLGLDKIITDVNPKLLSKKTLSKTTTWIDANGELVEHKFNDTYELYEVEGSYFNEGLNGRGVESCHYIRCKDTSTDREYLIWVDLRSVYNTNELGDRWQFDQIKSEVNAIQCIAWTIQTDIPKGNIEKIIRQGDCILIKPKGKYKPLSGARHLTEQEYKTLLVAES
jgi:hypothetical protein